MKKILLRPAEAADVLGVSRTKIYELISRGVVPSMRLDGLIRVPLDRLNDWVDAQMQAQRAESVEATP